MDCSYLLFMRLNSSKVMGESPVPEGSPDVELHLRHVLPHELRFELEMHRQPTSVPEHFEYNGDVIMITRSRNTRVGKDLGEPNNETKCYLPSAFHLKAPNEPRRRYTLMWYFHLRQ